MGNGELKQGSAGRKKGPGSAPTRERGPAQTDPVVRFKAGRKHLARRKARRGIAVSAIVNGASQSSRRVAALAVRLAPPPTFREGALRDSWKSGRRDHSKRGRATDVCKGQAIRFPQGLQAPRRRWSAWGSGGRWVSGPQGCVRCVLLGGQLCGSCRRVGSGRGLVCRGTLCPCPSIV